MDEEKLTLVRDIGNEICDGCGPDRDCELDYDECIRIDNALESLNVFLSGRCF